MQIDKNKINNILIINLKYIGDLIVATPVYEAIRNNFEKSKIYLMVQSGYRDVMQGNNDINELIECDLNHIRSLKGFKRISTEIKFSKFIKKFKFDLVIALHPTDRLVLWSFFSGARYRVAPKKQGFSFLINIPVDVEEESKSYLEYYLDMVRILEIPVKSSQTKFFLTDESNKEAEYFIRKHALENFRIIGIHPGASREEKRWDEQKYSDLIKRIANNTNYRIFIFEGPDESQIVQKINNEISSDKVFTIKCNDSIKIFGSFLKYCDLILCNDSSSRHIAAALNVKSLTLFSRDKYHCWKIYSEERFQYTIQGEICDECKNEICKGNKCLKNISVDEVYEKIISVLDKK